MERQSVAYLLIIVMLVLAGGAIAYAGYNSRERVARRRHRREQLDYGKRMAEKAAPAESR